MKALGIYVFAGGFTLGMRKHAQVVAHLEDAAYVGTESSQLNFPDVPIHLRGGKPFWDEAEQYRGVDVIYCNPPCAIVSPIGTSMKNGAEAWRTDVRTNCWLRCFQALDLEPKMLWIESVPAIASKARSMLDAMAKNAMLRGYNVTYLWHNGSAFGLPHHRRRFFFVAHKHRLVLPDWVKRTPPTAAKTLARVGDPGWILAEKKSVLDVYPKMRHRENGGWEAIRVAWCRVNGIDPDPAVAAVGRPMLMYHRLSNDVTPNVCAGNYWFHPTKRRKLGINEYKAFCGYPQSFKLAGPPGRHVTLLVQAVLPPVGAWVGECSVLTLKAHRLTNRPEAAWRGVKVRYRPAQTDLVDLIERQPPILTAHPTFNPWDEPVDMTEYTESFTGERVELVPEKTKPARQPREPRQNSGVAIRKHEWVDKKIKLLIDRNPRRPGSETFTIFEYYEDGITVGEFIRRGGRYVDVKHDLERGHVCLA